MRAAHIACACGASPCAGILRAVIILPGADAPLDAAERFGLALLVDLSRLVPIEDRSANVVRIEMADAPDAGDLAALAGRRFGIVARDGVVHVPRTLLATVQRLATAEHERASTSRDRLGRVPPTANALVAAGIERDPVVSRAAIALRDAATSAAGSRALRLVAPWPEGKRWAVALSHDVDVVAAWPLFTALRLVELARKGELRRALSASVSALGSIGRGAARDGVCAVLDYERPLRSTWFILCGTPTFGTFKRGDLTYRPESRATRAIIRAILDAGGEIGLHGSAETVERGSAFAEQRARLAAIAGVQPLGVRQHFLRIRPGETQRAMGEAGFAYDSTLGFYDRNGFRLGVADVVPAWDAERAGATALAELPFCWMDRAMSKYRGEERPEMWVQDALALAATCREVEGAWVGVWHPNLTAPLGYPGALDAYRRLIDGLAADEPFIATGAELVRWRKARRAVRARGIRPDGSVAIDVPASSDAPPIVLEDARAAARERAAP